MSDEGCVSIELDDPIEKETEKAVMFTIDGEEFWIPKSAICPDSEVTGLGDKGTLIVLAWVARKKGLV